MAGSSPSFDCVVIGSGPGGYVAAIRAAQLGMKTAVVERADTVGGRCLNEACIPAKAILRVADAYKEVTGAGSFGISTGDVSFDFSGAAGHRDKVIKTMVGGVSMLFDKNGIEVISGQGSLTEDGNVKVGGSFDGQEIEAGKVVLATGSIAKPLLGLQFGGRILDTASMWLTSEQPKRLAVIGAGASGTEVASAFGRLGTEVTLIEALDQILPLEDKDAARACAREIAKQNVKIVTGANVESAEDTGDVVRMTIDGESHEFDLLCIAAGRAADVEGLALDEAGVKTDERGLIEVDGALRTSKENVYAIGDLVPGPALAHKASDEGIIAVEDAAGLPTHPIDYPYVPRVTFCSPQVASFGLTEAQAKEAGHDVAVGKIPMGAVGAPTVYGDRTGLVKIVGDKRYGEILGAHIVSPKAAELIEELVIARDLEGGYPELARSIHPHPAFAETILEAARATDGWLIHG
jgi:dihydrolipoamide dehydrogenase